jgi:hypothetical protein
MLSIGTGTRKAYFAELIYAKLFMHNRTRGMSK